MDKKFFSIRSTFLLINTAIMFVAISSIIILFTTKNKRLKLDELKEHSISLTKNLASIVIDDLLTEEFIILQEYIIEFTENKLINSITVSDLYGQVLADFPRSRIGNTILPLHANYKQPKNKIIFHEHNQRNIIILYYPLIYEGELLGMIENVISTIAMQDEINQTLLDILVLGIIVWFLGTLLVFWASKKIISPIIKLDKIVTKISKGNFCGEINIRANNEIGRLADSFRMMLSSLNKTTVSKNYVNNIIMNVGDSLIVTRQNGDIKIVNKATTKMLGTTEDHLKNINIKEIINLKNTNNDCFLQSVETTFTGNNNNIIPVLLSSSQIDNDVIYIASDLTAKKKQEKKQEKMNKEFIEISRQAGMSEIATGILHNIGNILNSVNVSSNIIFEKVSHSVTRNLSIAADLIKENNNDIANFISNDEKGKLLPQYYIEVAKDCTNERNIILDEAKGMIDNIDQIKLIIATQQALATKKSYIEEIQVKQIIQHAIDISFKASLTSTIEIIIEGDENLSINIDRLKLLQILMNLFSNARHSILAKSGYKEIMIKFADVDNKYIQIIIQDNGIGIPNENLIKIFNFGFTTKKDGHGFGLHNSSLIAKDLGGNITCTSNGTNQGAIFTLQFISSQGLRI